MGFNLETDASSCSSVYHSNGIEYQQDRDSGQSYRCLAVLPGHNGQVLSLTLASDHTIYSGSDRGDIRVSRWLPPEIIHKSINSHFDSAAGSVKAMVVVGNKVITAHQDQKIRVWKPVSKRQAGSSHRLVATVPTARVYLMTYITLKSYLQCGSAQAERPKKAFWMDHYDTISVLAVGKSILYSGSWDRTIKVWRLADLKCVESITAHLDAVNGLAVDQVRGFLYSGSADGTVKVWERSKSHLVSSGSMRHSAVAILEASKNQSVNTLALTPDGTTCYAGSSDKCIVVWEMDEEGTGEHMKNVAVLRGHRLAVLCLASVANLLVSGSADKTIRVWKRDLEDRSHRCLSVLHGHCRPVKCLAAVLYPMIDAGLMVYSGSMDSSVRVWWVSLVDQDDDKGTALSFPEVKFFTPLKSSFPPLSQAWLVPYLLNRLQQYT